MATGTWEDLIKKEREFEGVKIMPCKGKKKSKKVKK